MVIGITLANLAIWWVPHSQAYLRDPCGLGHFWLTSPAIMKILSINTFRGGNNRNYFTWSDPHRDIYAIYTAFYVWNMLIHIAAWILQLFAYCTVSLVKQLPAWFISSLQGILSDIYFDILSGILPGIHSSSLSGIYSDILSGILCGILSGILFGILSGILFGIYSDICLEVQQCPLRSGAGEEARRRRGGEEEKEKAAEEGAESYLKI